MLNRRHPTNPDTAASPLNQRRCGPSFQLRRTSTVAACTLRHRTVTPCGTHRVSTHQRGCRGAVRLRHQGRLPSRGPADAPAGPRPLAPYLWRDPRSMGDVLVGAAPSLMAGHSGLSRGQDQARAARRGRTVLTPARAPQDQATKGAGSVVGVTSQQLGWGGVKVSRRAGVQPYLGARSMLRRHDG